MEQEPLRTQREERRHRVGNLVAITGIALLLVTLGLFASRLVLFASHSIEMIAFPWQVDFDEGVILHSSWLLSLLHNPYPANSPDYFVSSIYPPVYYVLNAIALKLFGLNLWSGRALSLLGALLAAASLVWWVRAETRSVLAGPVAAAVWLSLGPTIVWSSFYKQDTLALGFGVLGGAMLAAAASSAARSGTVSTGAVPSGDTHPETSGPAQSASSRLSRLPRWGWVAIIPLVTACWTKQSAVAGLAACALFLLLTWDWRVGIRWCGIAFASLTVPFFLLNWLLQGQLYTHLVMPNAEPLSVGRLKQNMEALWYEHWPLILIATLTLLVLLLYSLRARRIPALSAWYAFLSVPILVWTNLSPHANYNHLLDGLLPICLLVGVGLGHLQTRLSAALRPPAYSVTPGLSWRVLSLGVLTGVSVLLALQMYIFTPLHRWYSPLGQPLDGKAQRMEGLEKALAAEPDDIVLTEDVTLALKAGKKVPYDDPAQMATQAESGHWDQSLLLSTINERNFPMVVLENNIINDTSTPRWSPAVLEALKANYVTKYSDVRFIDVPKPVPGTLTTALDCNLPSGPELMGIFLPGNAAELKAGSTQQLSLYWALPITASREEAGVTLKYSIRLESGQGKPIWQADLEPGATSGELWSTWKPGTSHQDNLTIPVPDDAPPGEYSVVMDAYLQQGDKLTPLSFGCPRNASRMELKFSNSEVGRPWGG